ncbi:MAG: hypothetical protein HY235_28450 [Acidobacteria bacterium]|nr:hypothetical protein [Acidobacteriota bacterium]
MTTSHDSTKHRSAAQTAASRANGAKSQGPNTPQGKQRSSQNALKHGLRSPAIVLSNESPQRYDQLFAAYHAEWCPIGQTENDLLLHMVHAQWRLRRLWAQETAILDSEIFLQKPDFDHTFSTTTPALRQADALMNMAVGNPFVLEYLNRAELRLLRAYDRALKHLLHLQTIRLGREPALQPATPQPEIKNGTNKPGSPPPQTPPSVQTDPRNYDDPEMFAWLSAFIPSPNRPSKHRNEWKDSSHPDSIAPAA